jgi:hypothetical protein
MYQIAARIWNQIAPDAKNPAWKLRMELNQEQLNEEVDRIGAQLRARGFDNGSVILSYIQMAPLLHERVAINKYLATHPQFRSAFPKVETLKDAVMIAIQERRLNQDEVRSLWTLMQAPVPDYRKPQTPVPNESPPLDDWVEEAFSMNFLAADYGVACSAEIPDADMSLEEYAELDEDFDDEFHQCLEVIMNDPMMILAIEQTCDHGVLLPVDRRVAKLASLSGEILKSLGEFWGQCDPIVMSAMTNYIFWLVRSERMRRLGELEWPAAMALRVRQDTGRAEDIES